MNKTILITGASSGIGAACVKIAVNHKLKIIATARNQIKLEKLANDCGDLKIITADISTSNGRQLIANSINTKLDFILHNAALLEPPQEFSQLKLHNFRKNISTNVEPILFLTQKLIPQINHKARILNVSSGVALKAIGGLGNYCVSKAAALMASQILKVELDKFNILVNDYFPGVVDTKMQETLRSSSQDVFQHSDDFKKLKTSNKLNSPTDVAKHIFEIFSNSNDDLFQHSKWCFLPED